MPTTDKRGLRPRAKGVVQVNGIRKEKIFPDTSQRSWREAVVWEEQMRKMLQNQQVQTVKSNIQTGIASLKILTLFNSWLDFVLESNSPRTYEEKSAAARRLIKFVGKGALVEDIDSSIAMEFLRMQNKERSGYGANRDRKNLITAWKYGRKYIRGFPLGENPFEQTERFPEVRSPRYIPSESDFYRILDIVDDEQDRTMLLFALHTAARKGEIFRAKVEDLDFDRETIRISTCKRSGGHTEIDTIPMTNNLKEALRSWLGNRPKKSEFVFINLSEHNWAEPWFGQPFKARQHFMRKLCEKAGVKPFGFHSIRHLTASMLYKEGQSVQVIQQVLRHKSATTTARYLHSLGLKEAAEGLKAVMDK